MHDACPFVSWYKVSMYVRYHEELTNTKPRENHSWDWYVYLLI